MSDPLAVAMAVQSGARLDRLPISRFHRRLAFLIGAGMFFDGFDLYLAANVLGALAKSGFSNLELNGWFTSATFLGMMIGAFFAGWLGDRFGRRFSYQANLMIYGIASLVAALAPNMQFLIAARFVIGLGLGAEIVVGYATFTEFVPPAVRGRWLGILALPVQASLFVASMIGLLVIPTIGWRPMFVIAGVGGLIVWYLRKNLPESPRWLEQQGRLQEAETVLRAIETESGVPPSVPAPRYGAPRLAAAPAKKSLLTPALLMRLVVGSTTLLVLNTVIFGFLSFIPTFFVKEGFSVVKSLGFSTIMTLGGPIGGLIALLIVDRLGRKATLVGSAVMAAFIGSFYPFVGSGALITVVGFLLVTTIYVNAVAAFAMYVPELFPTEMRLLGTGTCNTVGRIVGVIVPIVVVHLYAAQGVLGVVVMMVGFLIVQAVVVGAFGIEPTRRSLEELAPDKEVAAAPAPPETMCMKPHPTGPDDRGRPRY